MDKINQTKISMAGKYPYPIDFLRNYKEFAIEARPLMIDLIIREFKKSNNREKRNLLFLLGFEQFFFSLETLLAFFNMAVQEGPVDVAKWIMRTKQKSKNGKSYADNSSDFDKLNERIHGIKVKRIRTVYEAEFSDFNMKRIDSMVKPLIKIHKWLEGSHIKNRKKAKQQSRDLTSCFNKTKHKFLAYTYDNNTALLLSKEIENRFEKLSNNIEPQLQDIDHLKNQIEIVKGFTLTAIDRIICRLERSKLNRWISGPCKNGELFNLCPPQSLESAFYHL